LNYEQSDVNTALLLTHWCHKAHSHE